MNIFEGSNELKALLASIPGAIEEHAAEKFRNAQANIFDESQSTVAQDTGQLKETGRKSEQKEGSVTQFDITYGDVGQSYGAKYGMQDGGYSWFVELGHMTRSGTMVPPNPYLGPAFSKQEQSLPGALEGLINEL